VKNVVKVSKQADGVVLLDVSACAKPYACYLEKSLPMLLCATRVTREVDENASLVVLRLKPLSSQSNAPQAMSLMKEYYPPPSTIIKQKLACKRCRGARRKNCPHAPKSSEN